MRKLQPLRAGQFQKIKSRCGISCDFNPIIEDLLKDFLRRLDPCLN